MLRDTYQHHPIGMTIKREAQQLAPDLKDEHEEENVSDCLRQIQEVERRRKEVSQQQSTNQDKMLRQYRETFKELHISDLVLYTDH